jgi:hypothetical protein
MLFSMALARAAAASIMYVYGMLINPMVHGCIHQ